MSRKSNNVTIASYGWKDGAGEFRKFDAAKIASELERVREKDGVLKPSNVVDAARAPSSPLHPIFPWDDVEAARIGREAIASRLIRSITVQIVTPERKQIDTRAFVSAPDQAAKGSRSYVATSHAMEDEEGRAMLLRQAWLELRAWKRKYAELSELAAVFDAIDRAVEGAA